MVAPKAAPFFYDKANVFEDIIMRWAFGLVGFYRENPPTFQNTIHIPNRLQYSEQYEEFKLEWEVERKSLKPNLSRVIWKIMRRDFFIALIPSMISCNTLIISTLMMIYIIEYMDSTSEPAGNIVLYIIVYTLAIQTYSLFSNYSYYKISMVLAKLKGFLSEIIYEKTLKTLYRDFSKEDQTGKFSSLL